MSEEDRDLTGITLAIPDKPDVERDSVAAEWERLGGQVIRLGAFWSPPEELAEADVRLYGNDTFCLVVAQKLNVNVISARDEMVAEIGQEWTRRSIEIRELSEANELFYPCFVKPVTPKQFRAAVYESKDALEEECKGLDTSEGIMVSNIVSIESEARCFILDGKVLDGSVYEGDGNAAESAEFVQSFCDAHELPKTCVIDAGYVTSEGWAILEFNSSWGAGLNGCYAAKVLPAIEAASGTKGGE